ncbi:hypothetical protein AB6846_01635 [Serratia proteamaculans]
MAYASQQMEALNGRYPCEGASVFTATVSGTKKQGVWMGLERKRGNRMQGGNAFCTQIGDGLEVLKNVKYVITLDSDTVLPRESAHQFTAMAHPLNQPQYLDARQQRVVEGYAILQPRMAEEIPSYGQGRYAALCSSTPGNYPLHIDGLGYLSGFVWRRFVYR